MVIGYLSTVSDSLGHRVNAQLVNLKGIYKRFIGYFKMLVSEHSISSLACRTA